MVKRRKIMKKFFVIMSFILTFVFVMGCSSNNSAQVRMASQKLSSGIDQIITLTNKLDCIDTYKMDINSVLSNEETTLKFNNFLFSNNTKDRNFIKDLKFRAPFYNENYRKREPVEFLSNNCDDFLKDKMFFKPNSQGFEEVRCAFGDKIKPCQAVSENENYASLYTLSNDCKNLNIEYISAKANILKNCSEAKANLKKLKESKKNISEKELRTLTSYYEVVKDCINNVKSCKSCSTNVNNINKKKTNLATNSGVINSEFLQVYNKLDSNCCTLNNVTYCVNEINCFVKNINGENCSATTSVNPYIRNNRYLSSVNKEKNKNYYSSQHK